MKRVLSDIACSWRCALPVYATAGLLCTTAALHLCVINYYYTRVCPTGTKTTERRVGKRKNINFYICNVFVNCNIRLRDIYKKSTIELLYKVSVNIKYLTDRYSNQTIHIAINGLS